MSDRLHVDTVSLEGIADRLQRSGDSLQAAGSGAPATPDAGVDTPIFNELLARLTLDTTNLAGGLGAAAARVIQANQVYADEDLGNARNLTGGR